jgi:DNA-directed RNA polymerase subunit K
LIKKKILEKKIMPRKKSSTKKDATPIILTRFEKARLIGARALQLSMGAKPQIEVTGSIDPIDIATQELKENVLPLEVKRVLVE